MNNNTKVGYIGLGIMGQPAAINLIKAGYDVCGFARNPQKATQFTEAGGQLLTSTVAVAKQSDVLIVNLPDSPEVKEVLLDDRNGAINGLRKGSIVVDMSTISPVATRQIAEQLSIAQVDFIDAPVSGGSIGAIEGNLSFMVGGKKESVDRLMPLLNVMGSQVVHVGAVGSGQLCKCCNQMMVAQLINAVSEVIGFAQSAGVNPHKIRKALMGGFASSRALDIHGMRMLEGNYEPGFKAELHHKDMGIVKAMCNQLNFDAPATSLAQQLIERLVNVGKGELDSAAIHLLRS